MPKTTNKERFVGEFLLRTSPRDRAILRRRFHMAGFAYNYLLQEVLERDRRYHEDPRLAQAAALSKRARQCESAIQRVAAGPVGEIERVRLVEVKKGLKAEADSLYGAIQKEHGYSEFALYQPVPGGSGRGITALHKSYIQDHLDHATLKALARRAWLAVAAWHRVQKERIPGQPYDPERGKPRFVNSRLGVESVEGRDHKSTLHYDKASASILWNKRMRSWDPEGHRWKGGKIKRLQLSLVVNPQDPVHQWVACHVAADRIMYARIVRRQVGGNRRGEARDYYYAQLVIDGTPLQKHEIGEGVIGLDLGPSTIAVSGIQGDSLEKFADELVKKDKKVRRLQRKADREHRVNSPACFGPDGVHVKGKCPWKRAKSKRAKQNLGLLREARRSEAAQRTNLHGRMANKILGEGNQVKTEKLSYKSWQRNRHFAKSVAFRAPATFLRILRQKVEANGGEFFDINTFTTALSQTCLCGARKKKPLSKRTHHCAQCGFTYQRDKLSAFLARFVYDFNGRHTLDLEEARQEWNHMWECNPTRTEVGTRVDPDSTAQKGLASLEARTLRGGWGELEVRAGQQAAASVRIPDAAGRGPNFSSLVYSTSDPSRGCNELPG